MTDLNGRWDAVVVGGGFYGTSIAIHLATARRLCNVLLVEREGGLLTRASFNNQARVHNGYHYPRSFTTAYRSRVNLPRFLEDWPEAVQHGLTKLYAIARSNSHTNARQFVRFCRQIGAPLEPADAAQRSLFAKELVEDVFVVRELAFDAAVLAARARDELATAGVEVRLNTRVTSIHRSDTARLRVTVQDARGNTAEISSDHVFNCTYSGLNQLGGDFTGTRSRLKHEITEMALVAVPDEVGRLGITVMDGPYFSLMPFPSAGLHTLSHVRYTPHLAWQDAPGVDPYARLGGTARASRFDRMVRDARRYVPALESAVYARSLFEVKTVLARNETDDGRPILFEHHDSLPGCYSILGGKIDNVYDALERLEAETLHSLRGGSAASLM